MDWNLQFRMRLSVSRLLIYGMLDDNRTEAFLIHTWSRCYVFQWLVESCHLSFWSGQQLLQCDTSIFDIVNQAMKAWGMLGVMILRAWVVHVFDRSSGKDGSGFNEVLPEWIQMRNIA